MNHVSIVDTIASMTQAQYQHLVSLLSAQQIKPMAETHNPTMVTVGIIYFANHIRSTFEPHTWIIDSGVTSHIASTLSIFHSHTTVHNFFVTLPDYTRIPVHSIGSVHLTPNLILHDVLYVPGFKVNLISISALLSNTSYNATFTDNSCFVQDNLTSKVIGKGDLLGGLYVLQQISPAQPGSFFEVPVMNNVSVDVWHARLGYISNKVLNKLVLTLSLPSNFSHDYDICPLAKLRRLSFPSNNNMCTAPFNLIHCDIWDPYHVPTYNGKRFFLTIVDDYNRFTWTYLLQHKSEATALLGHFFYIN